MDNSELDKWKRLHEVGIALAAEEDTDIFHSSIVSYAREMSGADCGMLYKVVDGNQLEFTVMLSGLLTLQRSHNFPRIKLFLDNGAENSKSVIAHAAICKQSIKIDDVGLQNTYDFVDSMDFFEKILGGRPVSLLSIPMLNQNKELVGVLLMINARDSSGSMIPFSDGVIQLLKALTSQAAVGMENHETNQQSRELLEAFMQMIASIIDTKNHSTNNRSERIPAIVNLLAEAACNEDNGVFKDFHLTSNQWHELRIASWFHDLADLITPQHILDKSTKLQTIADRIAVIHLRFEVLWKDAQVKYFSDMAHIQQKPVALQAMFSKEAHQQLLQAQAAIQSDWEFLEMLNQKNSFTTNQQYERLMEIARREWRPEISAPSLNIKSKVTLHFFTEDELHNLSVRKGNLNNEEREIIYNQIKVADALLRKLPFPSHMKHVYEYASAHFNENDPEIGKKKMAPQAAMIIFADIFESLTASDRSYKKAKTLQETLDIMREMKAKNSIDGDLFDLFVTSKAYLKYAQKYLSSSDQVELPEDNFLKPIW